MRALYDSFVLFPLAEHGAPGFRVFPNTRALYSVRLWGPSSPSGPIISRSAFRPSACRS